MRYRNVSKTDANLKNGMKLLKGFFQQNYIKYLYGIVAIIFVNIFSMVTPILSGYIVDELVKSIQKIGDLTTRRLLILCSIFVFVALLSLISNYFTRVFILGVSYIFDYETRNKMFNKLLKLSVDYYNKRTTGEIMALSSNDLNAVTRALGMGMMNILRTIVLLIFSITYLTVKLNFSLTFAVFIPFPFIIILVLKFGKIIHKRFRKVQETYANMTGKVEEAVSGIRVIKSFVQEEQEINNFKKVNEENYKANVSLAKLQAIFNPSLSLLSNITYFILLIYGGILTMDGTISIGGFIIVNGFLGMLVRPIRFIGMIINFLERGKVSISRISELIFQKPSIYDGKYGKTLDIKELPKRLKGNIEIKNLSYKYKDKEDNILNNINIEINSGETLGVIGEIGSGKTTLVNLLMRMFDFSEKNGNIFIDGYDIKNLPLKYLRENISYVTQDNFLFSDTISYNVSFCEKDHSIEEIIEATKKSKIHESIEQFKNGYEALLGEKGVNISGGQKQRLCIARALIQQSPIMVFDDCLSAIDLETEREILKALKSERKGRTSIIIAHRISTIKDADKIIVLHNGKILESGTHDQLLKLKGEYSKIYKLQLMESSKEGEM